MRLLVVCLFFFYINISFSQIDENSVFTIFNTENGLHSNRINAINQDKDGYIWIGTINGLSKYDGYTFTNYFHIDKDSTSIPHDRIFDIEVDSSGTVWAATGKGLLKYNKSKDNFQTFSFSNGYLLMQDDIVENVEIDSKENIWFTTSKQICKLDNKSHKISPYQFLDKHIQNIKTFKIDKDDNVWFANGTDIYSFNTITKKNTLVKNFPELIAKNVDEVISSLNVNSKNFVWIGTTYGNILLYNVKTKQTIYYENSLNNSTVEQIYTDSKANTYFVKGQSILSVFNKQKQCIEPLKNNYFSIFDNRNIKCLFEDKQHNYWIGNQNIGLCNAQSINKFHSINTNTFDGRFLKSNIVSSLCIDKKQTLWIGTDGGGVYYKTIKSNTLEYFAQINSLVVLSINEDNDGNIWFGTFKNGVFQYNTITKSLKNIVKSNSNNSISANDIRKIIVDKDGVYWFATHGQGVSSFNSKTNKIRNYNTHPFSGKWTFDVVCDKENNIWISSTYGLTRIDKNRDSIQLFVHKDGDKNTIINDHIFALYIDKSNNLWCATQSGLSKYAINKKTFSHYLVSKEVSVNSIIADNSNNLWLGTSNGIVKLNPNGYVLERFSSKNGLKGSYYNYKTCVKDPVGNLYFGGINGITFFHPDSITNNNNKAPFLSLTDISINNSSIKSLSAIQLLKNGQFSYSLSNLHYNENNIDIVCTAINFINPQENQYSYRLLGFDSTWQFGKFPQIARYRNIPPGEYVFQIKASNNNNIWTKNVLSISFEINKPWWKTIFFRLLSLFCLIGITFLYIFYKTRAVRKENVILEQKVKTRTTELSKAVLELEKEKHKVEEQNEELIQIADKLQEQNLLLDKANKTKNRIYSIIAHDIKNPFSIVLNTGRDLNETYHDLPDNKRIGLIARLYSSAETIYNQLSNMLDWAIGQSDKMTYNPTHSNANKLVEEVLLLLQTIANNKQITIVNTIANDVVIYADKNMLMAIFRNLINNALKFTPNNGTIKLSAENNTDDKTVSITISDSGIGMSKEDILKILDPNTHHSTYGTKDESGTGLGIQICQQFTIINKGTFDIESELGKGSRIILSFPMGDVGAVTAEIKSNDLAIEKEFEITIPVMKSKSILIVEDNVTIQEHLKNELSKYFTVSCANNGVLAWEKIENDMPDIVLSDVAMPEMDGYTLCEKIKKNIQTSHIPVLLITAQRQDKDKFKGLELGANDYILKPYKISEILIKLKNIIENIEQLKKRFKLDEKDFSEYTSIDDKFIRKFTTILEQQYSNPELSVEQIGKEIGMSRTHLYKKVIALTGKNPSDLLQEIRINNAIQLLKNTDLTISEVAYAVGYNDSRYFGARFKMYTGKTPSEIKK